MIYLFFNSFLLLNKLLFIYSFVSFKNDFSWMTSYKTSLRFINENCTDEFCIGLIFYDYDNRFIRPFQIYEALIICNNLNMNYYKNIVFDHLKAEIIHKKEKNIVNSSVMICDENPDCFIEKEDNYYHSYIKCYYSNTTCN